jgi:hypothetical protein
MIHEMQTTSTTSRMTNRLDLVAPERKLQLSSFQKKKKKIAAEGQVNSSQVVLAFCRALSLNLHSLQLTQSAKHR